MFKFYFSTSFISVKKKKKKEKSSQCSQFGFDFVVFFSDFLDIAKLLKNLFLWFLPSFHFSTGRNGFFDFFYTDTIDARSHAFVKENFVE